MDNLFNAKEAQELTLSKRKNFDDVINTIKVMAGRGRNYATISTKEIREPEAYATKLIEMGYKVEVTEYFSINW